MKSTEKNKGSTARRILNIQTDTANNELKHEITAGLNPGEGKEKTLPTLLLYDVEGLKLFERITYLDEYYLTGEEIKTLERHARTMSEHIEDNSMVIELGSGNLRKIKILLDALEKAQKNVDYYALDLMESELERTLAEAPQYRYVTCQGLHGTYDDGLAWVQQPQNANKPKTILSLGSSIGNFDRGSASSFIRSIFAALGPNDSVLIGLDACQEPDKVYHAYNDSKGITHKFIANGLKHANTLLGSEIFRLPDWEILGRYDEAGGKHQAFVAPKRDLAVLGVSIKAHEQIRIEESYKYNSAQANELWNQSGALQKIKLSNDAGDYALHLLKKQPRIMFPTKPDDYAAQPVPSLDDWSQLWKVWDRVTRQMIPDQELLDKPIKLRNACIFYLGHIPTFLDMKITEATNTPATEPKYFYDIFERGIDPDVDNPEHCHAHSGIPDSWPELDVILTFQDRVRQRVGDLYKTGRVFEDAWTGRTVWLGFEHEVMHLETLLYMMLQSRWCNPPATAPQPDFVKLNEQAHAAAVENKWFDIPEQTIDLGLDDPDDAEGAVRHFGWDVEKPIRSVTVPSFKAKARPITNGEYARYMITTGKTSVPASWGTVESASATEGMGGDMNGNSDLHYFTRGKAVRTMYGPVPLHLALDWPVSASYDEVSACAQYMGGRVPTLEEARSIYYYADYTKKKEASKALGRTIPAVNGHLVNDGVEETPPSQPSVNGFRAGNSPDPNELYVNLDEANVGFKHWHPVSVTQNGDRLAGQGEMGGLWEWTSSALERQEGFMPMKLYPAYSDDFYDGKHNVVLGGSWATHPRVAGRKSFVNWYQRNYPYAWAGARLVKDA
ncbi:hypothetical protein LTR78_002028 [Recurvomyces mirabilis]|uniref:Uncharacterized protein n=1 Tax=Recurvomyces mirabilis TaxID=574656 RepID=A0AAE0WTU5_9PEZI|nr:hypothetical protein LTR78_002028 [Recurvomyces mirabilis]KAK5160486.1 hypothetical protein LTS14_001498 [Recurvomyces mirabilis]